MSEDTPPEKWIPIIEDQPVFRFPPFMDRDDTLRWLSQGVRIEYKGRQTRLKPADYHVTRYMIGGSHGIEGFVPVTATTEEIESGEGLVVLLGRSDQGVQQDLLWSVHVPPSYQRFKSLKAAPGSWATIKTVSGYLDGQTEPGTYAALRMGRHAKVIYDGIPSRLIDERLGDTPTGQYWGHLLRRSGFEVHGPHGFK